MKWKKEIESIVNKLQNEFKNVNFGYKYYEDENLYEIWYDDKSLKNNKKFISILNKLIDNLYDNGFYDFYFTYKEKSLRFNYNYEEFIDFVKKIFNELEKSVFYNMKNNKGKSLNTEYSDSDEYSLAA